MYDILILLIIKYLKIACLNYSIDFYECKIILFLKCLKI